MCKIFSIHPTGYYAWIKYAWIKYPVSKQAKRRHYILGFIKQFWLGSGRVYGYRKIYCDLREEGIQPQRGYRKPRPKVGAELMAIHL